MTNDRRLSFIVAEAEAGERLDRLLSARFPDISRSRFKDLVKSGQTHIGGAAVVEPNHRVTSGARIDVQIPEPEPAIPQAEAIPLEIVFEDEHLIVIDKPAGLVIHPAAGNWTGTLVNALIAHCGDTLSGIGGVRRPGIVHRLDKETSGVMVVAKTDAAHQGLSAQFAAHGRDGRLERTYRALVWGAMQRRAGTIDAALDRKASNRRKMAVVARGGRVAITHYQVEAEYPGADGRILASRLRCRLETGRTHQIRVHLAHAGHPLLGDTAYGSGFAASARALAAGARAALETIGRQALHAESLGFEHPVTGTTMSFRADPPADFQALESALAAPGEDTTAARR